MPCEVLPLRVDFSKNGCRCHANGQNAKEMKNTKMIIGGILIFFNPSKAATYYSGYSYKAS
jgi:hypothetical protein